MREYKDRAIESEKKIFIVIILLVCLFFIFTAIFFAEKIFAKDTTIETAKIEDKIVYKNENPINLEEVLKKNLNKQIKEELVVEEQDLEYTTKYKNNSELPSGVVQVLQEGRAGKKKVVVIKKYENEELIFEELAAENIIKSPVERIVEIGAGKMQKNYKAKEGDKVYVVATTVAVRLAPNESAEKICTLNKNDSAKILKIEDNWYFISTVEIKGYVPKECVTTQNPSVSQNIELAQNTKQDLVNKLNFNMDLRNASGLTLEQFKKVLSGNGNDKNKIFEENAEYFYYIEKQYNINGLFVASVGIHESAWGTSKISKDKKNLFGYGAVDSNPYGGAYNFATYAEGIDLLARVFVKYYLNQAGTTIYDGTQASGKFYNGSTLSAVNSKYASDKNWANSVYKWMQYLYNRL